MRHVDKLFAADARLQRAARAFTRVAADPSSSAHHVEAVTEDLRNAAEGFGRCMRAVTRGEH